LYVDLIVYVLTYFYCVFWCFLGHYCKAETRHPKQYPCPAGSYSNLTNLEIETDCTECPKGSYCLEGSSTPSGICPTGHYCPPGEPYIECLFTWKFKFRTKWNIFVICRSIFKLPESLCKGLWKY